MSIYPETKINPQRVALAATGPATWPEMRLVCLLPDPPTPDRVTVRIPVFTYNIPEYGSVNVYVGVWFRTSPAVCNALLAMRPIEYNWEVREHANQ